MKSTSNFPISMSTSKTSDSQIGTREIAELHVGNKIAAMNTTLIVTFHKNMSNFHKYLATHSDMRQKALQLSTLSTLSYS